MTDTAENVYESFHANLEKELLFINTIQKSKLETIETHIKTERKKLDNYQKLLKKSIRTIEENGTSPLIQITDRKSGNKLLDIEIINTETRLEILNQCKTDVTSIQKTFYSDILIHLKYINQRYVKQKSNFEKSKKEVKASEEKYKFEQQSLIKSINIYRAAINNPNATPSSIQKLLETVYSYKRSKSSQERVYCRLVDIFNSSLTEFYVDTIPTLLEEMCQIYNKLSFSMDNYLIMINAYYTNLAEVSESVIQRLEEVVDTDANPEEDAEYLMEDIKETCCKTCPKDLRILLHPVVNVATGEISKARFYGNLENEERDSAGESNEISDNATFDTSKQD